MPDISDQELDPETGQPKALVLSPEQDSETDESAEPFKWDEDEPNLVATFEAHPEGQEALKKICDQVKQDFDRAWESTEQYRKRTADDWKIFTGDLPPKSYPWQNCANAHVPLMLENLCRLTFRSFDELFGDFQNVFKVLSVGTDDLEADILTLHGNWQLREQIGDFYRQQMRGMLLYFTQGDTTTHSYYDQQRKQNAHEFLTCDEFVIPYTYVSTRSDLSDVPFRVKILNRYRHELQAQRDTWEHVDDVIKKQKPSWSEDPEHIWAESQAKIKGVVFPEADTKAPYKLLHYEGWTDALPGQTKDRFVQVVVDYATLQPLHLCVYEEPAWQEVRRVEIQTQELQQYRDAFIQYSQAVEHLTQQRQQLEQQIALDWQVGVVDPGKQQLLHQTDPSQLQRPVPPSWIDESELDEHGLVKPDAAPKFARKDPIHMFVHGVCVEPIVGTLGFGFGRIQSDFNRAANVALSQFIDAASLANASGFIFNGLQFERPFSMGPGAINIAKGAIGQDLNELIYRLQTNPANPQLMDVVDKMREYSMSSIQAPEVLSGEPGKSGETFRGIATRVEQATKQLSVPTRGYALTVLTPILRNNARLNSVFLPDEEILQVNDFRIGHLPRELKITRKLYERDYRVQIVGDLQFTSRDAKIAEADQMLALPKAQPVLAQDLAFQYAATKAALEARGRYDLVATLGPPPPAPQTPFGLQPPQPQQPPQPGQRPAQPPQPGPAMPHPMPGNGVPQ